MNRWCLIGNYGSPAGPMARLQRSASQRTDKIPKTNVDKRLLLEREWHESVARSRDDNSLITGGYGLGLFDAGVAGI
jgi:hypothetical protein